jgi:hypothetical protein
MSGITANDLMDIYARYLDPGFSQNLESVTGETYWPELLSAVEQNVSGLVLNVQPQLSSNWTGTAAELASGHVTATANSLIHSQTQLGQVRDALCSFWQKLQTYASEMANAVISAGFVANEVTMGEDGTLSYASFTYPVTPGPMLAATDFFETVNGSSGDTGISAIGTGVVPSSYLVNEAYSRRRSGFLTEMDIIGVS